MSNFDAICVACKNGDIDTLKQLELSIVKYGWNYLLSLTNDVNTARYLIETYDMNSSYILSALYTIESVPVAKYLRKTLYNADDIEKSTIICEVLSNTTNEAIAELFDKDTYGVDEDKLLKIRPVHPCVIEILDNHVSKIRYMPKPNMLPNDKYAVQNLQDHINVSKKRTRRIDTVALAKMMKENHIILTEDHISETRSLYVAKYIVKEFEIKMVEDLNHHNHLINRWLYKKGLFNNHTLNELLVLSVNVEDAKYFIELGANNLEECFIENLHGFMDVIDGKVHENNYLYLGAWEDDIDDTNDALYINANRDPEVRQYVLIIKLVIELGVKVSHLPMQLCAMLLKEGCGVIINYMPKLLNYGIAEEYILKRIDLAKRMNKYLKKMPKVIIDMIVNYTPY